MTVSTEALISPEPIGVDSNLPSLFKDLLGAPKSTDAEEARRDLLNSQLRDLLSEILYEPAEPYTSQVQLKLKPGVGLTYHDLTREEDYFRTEAPIKTVYAASTGEVLGHMMLSDEVIMDNRSFMKVTTAFRLDIGFSEQELIDRDPDENSAVYLRNETVDGKRRLVTFNSSEAKLRNEEIEGLISVVGRYKTACEQGADVVLD